MWTQRLRCADVPQNCMFTGTQTCAFTCQRVNLHVMHACFSFGEERKIRHVFLVVVLNFDVHD